MNQLSAGDSFDVIVVGGGSAGVVVAARLSEDAALRILLVEAGEDYPPGGEPAAVRDTFHTAVYRAENMWPGMMVHWRSATASDGTRLPPRRYEQARIMGGGSSVNAMAAIRGIPGDYDEWDALGADGWGWDRVLPYFERLESDQDFSGAGHGVTGPIAIRRNSRENWPPFSRAAAQVLAARGYGYIDDLNLDFRDGLCAIPVSSLPTHRVSTAAGYLTAAVRSRQNLRLLARTRVKEIHLDGRRAIGVTVRSGDGHEQRINGRHVVLAAGSLHSPALLMQAGIGPADHLQSLGIRVLADLPGVGCNLQDHPAVAIAAHIKRAAMQSAGWRPAPNVSLRYSSNYPGCASADCWLSIANKTSWHPLGRRIAALGVSIYKPYSRGVVRLSSPSPMAEPEVEFRMLSDERDLARMRIGLKMALSVMTSPEVAGLVNASFLASFSERVRDLNLYSRRNWLRSLLGVWALDGPAPLRAWLIDTFVAPNARLDRISGNDEAMTDWILASTTGFYHPVGTCRMGRQSDRMAVTDQGGTVHGFENLHVADASLMPSIVRANTNIPTIMIAEKVSESIRSSVRSRPGDQR